MKKLTILKKLTIPKKTDKTGQSINCKTNSLTQDVTDGFVDVKLGNARIAKTRVIDNSLDPEWNETFRVEVNDFLKTW